MEDGCPVEDLLSLKRRNFTLGKKKIGEGSFGRVIEAKYKNIPLCCKYVDKRKAPDDFMNKFFPRELHFLTVISHPHLIRAHSIMQSNSSVFIFMRCAENGDLLSFIKKNGVINEDAANVWFYQMTSAVNYLHSMNIAHRDIKCENILITKKMNIKIGDFGFICSSVEEDMTKVLSSTFCGSELYCAPEIIDTIPYEPLKVDIWALGVVLSIMLYGKMPFDDKNPKKQVESQKNRKIIIDKSIKKKLSIQCIRVYELCLEPDCNKRIDIKGLLKTKWLLQRQEKLVNKSQ